LILHDFSGGFRSWAHHGFKVWFINSLLAFHFIELFSALEGTNPGSPKQGCSIACDLAALIQKTE